MKFAHLADCHIGSWSDPKLRELSQKTFLKAIEISIGEKVEFVLICGDLFNTSLPGIDSLKTVVEGLKALQDKAIRVYVISGSHDFSPSGKTILDVLEKARLIINVFKMDEGKLRVFYDEKTNTEIAGILGRRGGLEKSYFDNLSRGMKENRNAFRIFMFHTALKELLPLNSGYLDSISISSFPKAFNYYAGGHIHIISQKYIEGYGLAAYPGPLFPNNFGEFEELKSGGFYIVDTKDLNASYRRIALVNVVAIEMDCTGKRPDEVNLDLISLVGARNYSDTLVTLRLHGELVSGKTTEIDFRTVFEKLIQRGAYYVMKNSSKLVSREFREVEVKESSIEKIEEHLINENLGQQPVEGWDKDKEQQVIRQLMGVLDREKEEGETNTDFEDRIREDSFKII